MLTAKELIDILKRVAEEDAAKSKQKTKAAIEKIIKGLDQISTLAAREAPWGLDKNDPNRAYLRDQVRVWGKQSTILSDILKKVK